MTARWVMHQEPVLTDAERRQLLQRLCTGLDVPPVVLGLEPPPPPSMRQRAAWAVHDAGRWAGETVEAAAARLARRIAP